MLWTRAPAYPESKNVIPYRLPYDLIIPCVPSYRAVNLCTTQQVACVCLSLPRRMPSWQYVMNMTRHKDGSFYRNDRQIWSNQAYQTLHQS